MSSIARGLFGRGFGVERGECDSVFVYGDPEMIRILNANVYPGDEV